jgi:hypothetical protein
MTEEVKTEKKDEDWMQKKWRPAMGWMYMGICTLDMGIFPILWSVLQTVTHIPLTQWQPLTLQGAGLFHVAMGAVLGIAAFGRTQEKLAGAAQNPAPAPTSFAPPPSAGGFGSPTPSGFSVPTQSFAPASSPSFGGGFGGAASIQTTASGKKIVPDEPQPIL